MDSKNLLQETESAIARYTAEADQELKRINSFATEEPKQRMEKSYNCLLHGQALQNLAAEYHKLKAQLQSVDFAHKALERYR